MSIQRTVCCMRCKGGTLVGFPVKSMRAAAMAGEQRGDKVGRSCRPTPPSYPTCRSSVSSQQGNLALPPW